MNEEKKNIIYEKISRISIFGGLSLDQVELIIENSDVFSVEKDKDIVVQGHSPKSIYVIINGSVEIYQKSHDIIYPMLQLYEGDCFGEVEILGIIPNIASVKALEDIELMEIKKHQLHELSKTNISIFNMLILNMAREACRRLALSDKTLICQMENTNNN